jgi:MFS family permease
MFDNSIEKVLLLYGALYVAFALTAHVGAKLIAPLGMKYMMVLGIVFNTLMHIVRVFWDSNPVLHLILFILFFIIFKMLFWVPYHIELAAFTDKKKRGGQIALLENTALGFTIIMPFLSGVFLFHFGYSAMFFIASTFALLSAIPLLKMQDTKESYDWSIKKLVSEFFKKKNLPVVVSNIGNGIEDAVGSVIWPLFIFILLSGAYIQVGAVTTLVVISTIVLQYLFGRLTDKIGRKKAIEYGSFLNITGWIAKIFSESFVGIYLADTYHKLGKRLNMIPFRAAIYDEAEYNMHHTDEFMVLRETSFLIGKAFMLFVAIILIQFFSIKVTFIFAALATFTLILATKKVLIT